MVVKLPSQHDLPTNIRIGGGRKTYRPRYVSCPRKWTDCFDLLITDDQNLEWQNTRSSPFYLFARITLMLKIDTIGTDTFLE